MPGIPHVTSKMSPDIGIGSKLIQLITPGLKEKAVEKTDNRKERSGESRVH